MRALKTTQFTWIGNKSHVYKMLWPSPGILYRFDLAACKDILRDCNCFIWILVWLYSKVFVY